MKLIHRLIGHLNEMPRSYRVSLAWGYCLLLVYLLLAPSPLSPFGDWGLDTDEILERTLSSYLQHVFAYGVLVSIFWWGYRPKRTQAKSLLIGGACLHGAVFESLQYFVPTRYADLPDLFCNVSGVLLAAGLIQVFTSLGPSPAGSSSSFPSSIPLQGGK